MTFVPGFYVPCDDNGEPLGQWADWESNTQPSFRVYCVNCETIIDMAGDREQDPCKGSPGAGKQLGASKQSDTTQQPG